MNLLESGDELGKRNGSVVMSPIIPLQEEGGGSGMDIKNCLLM